MSHMGFSILGRYTFSTKRYQPIGGIAYKEYARVEGQRLHSTFLKSPFVLNRRLVRFLDYEEENNSLQDERAYGGMYNIFPNSSVLPKNSRIKHRPCAFFLKCAGLVEPIELCSLHALQAGRVVFFRRNYFQRWIRQWG